MNIGCQFLEGNTYMINGALANILYSVGNESVLFILNINMFLMIAPHK